jgi:hypothetical protein
MTTASATPTFLPCSGAYCLGWVSAAKFLREPLVPYDALSPLACGGYL